MKEKFERRISDIIQQVDGSRTMKEQLHDDLLQEMDDNYQAFINEGYREEEAVEKTLQAFGNTVEISEQLQQTRNPYQRKMMYGLALSSLLFSFLLYISSLFIERQAYTSWLISSVSLNIVLLLFVFRVLKADKKWIVNTVLLSHVLMTLYGLGLALLMDSFIVTGFVLYAILLILISLVLLYLNVIFHWEMGKVQRWFHLLNMTAGLVVICLNGYFLILFLMFSDLLFGSLLLMLIPFIVWLLLYVIQMQLIKKGLTKLAIGLAVITCLIFVGLIGLLIYFFS